MRDAAISLGGGVVRQIPTPASLRRKTTQALRAALLFARETLEAGVARDLRAAVRDVDKGFRELIQNRGTIEEARAMYREASPADPVGGWIPKKTPYNDASRATEYMVELAQMLRDRGDAVLETTEEDHTLYMELWGEFSLFQGNFHARAKPKQMARNKRTRSRSKRRVNSPPPSALPPRRRPGPDDHIEEFFR